MSQVVLFARHQDAEPTQDLDPAWGWDNLRQAQERDADLLLLLKWMEEGEQKPEWSTVSLHSDTVKEWSVVQTVGDPSCYSVIWRLMGPKELQRDYAFNQLHATPSVGHLGIKKTLSRIQEWFH